MQSMKTSTVMWWIRATKKICFGKIVLIVLFLLNDLIEDGGWRMEIGFWILEFGFDFATEKSFN